jgi:hypothetical protein
MYVLWKKVFLNQNGGKNKKLRFFEKKNYFVKSPNIVAMAKYFNNLETQK